MANTNGRPKADTSSKAPASRPKADTPKALASRPKADMPKAPASRPKTEASKSSQPKTTRPSENASKKARIVAEATESANMANKTKNVAPPRPAPMEQKANPKPKTIVPPPPPLQKQKANSESSKVITPKPESMGQKVDTPPNNEVESDTNDNQGLDLFVDASELEQLEDKKKKRRKGAYYDKGDLNNKKKKKKRRLLWLLLLLLLLIIILVVVFRDILFPPKPIVVVPQGMVLKIKSTGQSTIGMEEFIFKPGDTIEFENPISVYSEKYVYYEDGSRDELSPFTLRLRFYIEYEGIEYKDLIDHVEFSKQGLFTDYNGWFYYNDIVIPDAKAVNIVDNLHLNSDIDNVWQGREVSLVLAYETICPKSTEVLDEAFEYNYPIEWGIIVVEGYNNLS